MCKVTNLPLPLTKKGEYLTFTFTWHDCTSFTNTTRRICPASFNARRLTLRNFFLLWILRVFFSFFTGRVLSLKLIRLNRHHDRFCMSRLEACCFFFKKKTTRIASRQPGRATLLCHNSREPFTSLKMADAGIFNVSFSIGPFWAAKKKSNLRKRTIF